MNVYVYYDVPLATCGEASATIRTMQATLTGHARRIALLRRPDAKPAAQTWMEVYEDVSADFEARLAEAVIAHPLATTARHIERFVPVD